MINTLESLENDHHLADESFKRNLPNSNVQFSITISRTFVPCGPFNNTPVSVQTMILLTWFNFNPSMDK